jgi:hypothetical protein
VLALTPFLIEWLLWAPLKPGQIWILSLRAQRASGLLGLALFPSGILLTPLDLLRFLTVSFCDSRFSCSSDGALLCGAPHTESRIACCLYRRIRSTKMVAMIPSRHGVSCCLR